MSTAPAAPGQRVGGAAGHRVDSEVGRLRTVLLHRPGGELQRLTPRNSADLLFDGIPWVERAQQEHDRFADTLRGQGVQVLYLRDLLVDVLGLPAARVELVDAAVGDPRLGDRLRQLVSGYLLDLPPAELADVLVGGLAHEEMPAGDGLVYRLMPPADFVVPPLPNLLFTRDSSAWVHDAVAVTSPSMPARRREASITDAVYRHHPRFAGTPLLYQAGEEGLEGGDVLLLGRGVVAIGVGQRTVPAAAEKLGRRLFERGLAHTVLVVPVAQERATMHLDTVCTMVDVDAVVMYPAVADRLTAHPVGWDGAGLRLAPPEPFLLAAADALGIDTLRVIDTGLDPVTAEREQWDDGNNTLAVAPRLAVAYERNTRTNARLAQAGVRVLAIPGSELGSGRGGPRCMSCPLLREPLPVASGGG